MISAQDNNIYVYEQINNDEIRLLRVWGQYSVLTIPQKIGEQTVTVIGAYCFAPASKLSEELEQECANYLREHALKDSYRTIAGDFLCRIILPDSVRCLESYVFYNCRELEEITAGAALREVNGDALMNCRKLGRLKLRESVDRPTGLSFLLGQITSEIEVVFQKGDVRLVYPEFSESYEEIGPAHIFHLQVEGEGFRARNQFQSGVVDLAGYDQVFENAVRTESAQTLIRMASDRLCYPADIKEAHRLQYEVYLRAHEQEWMRMLVQNQDEETMEAAGKQGLISNQAREYAVQEAAASGWIRGSAALLRGAAQRRSVIAHPDELRPDGIQDAPTDVEDEYNF